MDLVLVLERGTDEPAGARVPQAGHAVAAGGQQLLAIGTEERGKRPVRMGEAGELLARRQLPDAHLVVRRGGGNQPAIGRELHVIADALVFEFILELAGECVPHAHRVGDSAEGQEASVVRAEADGAVVGVTTVFQMRWMRLPLPERLAGGRIDHDEFPCAADHGELPAVRAVV